MRCTDPAVRRSWRAPGKRSAVRPPRFTRPRALHCVLGPLAAPSVATWRSSYQHLASGPRPAARRARVARVWRVARRQQSGRVRSFMSSLLEPQGLRQTLRPGLLEISDSPRRGSCTHKISTDYAHRVTRGSGSGVSPWAPASSLGTWWPIRIKRPGPGSERKKRCKSAQSHPLPELARARGEHKRRN